MAGQPRKRAMREELDRRTREFFEGDEAKTHLDYALCLVASGTSIRKLAIALTKSLRWDREGVEPLNREMLRRYLKGLDDEHYDERMKAAQEEGAHAYAEHSVDVLDEADADEASLASAKSRAMQWYAEKCNRKAYGRDVGPLVQLNVAQLMLQALEAPPPLRPSALSHSPPLAALTASASLPGATTDVVTVDAELFGE